MELLKVDEGRALVAGLRQEIEGEHLVLPVEHAPALPGDTALDQPLGEAQPAQDLQGPLGPADRTAALGRASSAVDDDTAMAVAREIQREHKSHGPGTCNDDGVVRRPLPVLVPAAAIGKSRAIVSPHRPLLEPAGRLSAAAVGPCVTASAGPDRASSR